MLCIIVHHVKSCHSCTNVTTLPSLPHHHHRHHRHHHQCHSSHTHRHYQWHAQHTQQQPCVSALPAVCAYEQVVPASKRWESDRPPTFSGSAYWCQFGVSGRAANGISLSAPQCSHHVSSPTSVTLRTVKQGKTARLGLLKTDYERHKTLSKT